MSLDKFIEVNHSKHGRMLLTQFEYAGGHMISEKVIKGREKLERLNQIEVIQNENDFDDGEKRKIHRKGHIR